MEPKKDSELFRKKALEHQATSQQIDEMIRIVPKKYWVLVFMIALVIISAILWAFLGSIPIRVQGEGILIAEKGALYNAVAPEGATRLISLRVKPGDTVKKGAIIALLESPDLMEELKTAKSYQRLLEEEYATLTTRSEKEIQKQTSYIQAQNETLNAIFASETQNLDETKKLLTIKEESLKKGIISRLDVAVTLRDYHQTIKELERVKESVTQNKIKMAEFITQWQEKLRVLRLKMLDQEYQVNILNAKLRASKEVLSPISGIVTNIQAAVGDKIDGGEIIATITNQAINLDAILYIPATDGKLVAAGMQVFVSPSTVKKEEYGSIKGTVVEVSHFPSTEKDMLAILQNENIVKAFIEKGTLISIRVELKKNLKNYSGYAWTSSLGPRQNITAGTLITAAITVREQKPIALIIPALKKATSLDL